GVRWLVARAALRGPGLIARHGDGVHVIERTAVLRPVWLEPASAGRGESGAAPRPGGGRGEGGAAPPGAAGGAGGGGGGGGGGAARGRRLRSCCRGITRRRPGGRLPAGRPPRPRRPVRGAGRHARPRGGDGGARALRLRAEAALGSRLVEPAADLGEVLDVLA